MADFTRIPEIVDSEHRLGRHISRPEGFAMRTPATVPPKTTKWVRHTPAFNQGNLGSCTGNAAAGALMTEPFYHVGRNLTEVDAVSFYSKATTFDDFPAVYPPTDCGSSGPGVAKAVASLGYISSYSHVTDLNSALGALTMAPGIFGVAWMDTFDQPQSSGEAVMTASSQVRGGHEIQAFGLDMEQRQVWFYQSWGPTWGPLGNGTFWLSFDTLDAQLSGMQSDGTFFQLAPDFHPTV